MPGTTTRARRQGAARRGGRGKQSTNNSNKVGAAWENLDDNGNVSNISVIINEDADPVSPGERLTLFPNSYKEQPKHPDYNVIKFTD